MISRSYRFHGYNSLRRVYREGQTIRGPQITLKYVASKRSSYRLAVVVSRQVNKSAVVRNRIRRRIYEVFRLNFADNIGSYDLVITVFSDLLASISSEQLRDIVLKTLQKAEILADEGLAKKTVSPKTS
jgi:ribonuclease P protein component